MASSNESLGPVKTLGAVLAGGKSSRFGSDKAVAMLAGCDLLTHAVAALRPHCDDIVVVGRQSVDFGAIPDWPRPGMGPLGGIAGALDYAAAHGFGQLLTIPVDCVRLPADLRDLLEPAPAFLADQPVIGLWPVTAMDALRKMLATGDDLAVRAFARWIDARAAKCDFPLANINRVEDLDRLAAGVQEPL